MHVSDLDKNILQMLRYMHPHHAPTMYATQKYHCDRRALKLFKGQRCTTGRWHIICVTISTFR